MSYRHNYVHSLRSYNNILKNERSSTTQLRFASRRPANTVKAFGADAFNTYLGRDSTRSQSFNLAIDIISYIVSTNFIC